jgi:MOSC domain-containing protein YiiM
MKGFIMATVFQINTSPGGLPKLAITEAFVGETKVGEDGHNYKGHGGPNAAVCLFSLERILALQAEGHPVFPGALGENLTITGLEWEQLQAGTQLQVGEVLLEIVSFATPCPKLKPYLTDIMAVSQEQRPGWGRPYCKVLQTGTVRIGDEVSVIEV